MLAPLRVGLVAALVTIASFSSAAFAADNAYQRDDLADAAIKCPVQ